MIDEKTFDQLMRNARRDLQEWFAGWYVNRHYSNLVKIGMKKIFDTKESFDRNPELEELKYYEDGSMVLIGTKEEEEYSSSLLDASLLSSALRDQVSPNFKELMFDDPPVWFATLDNYDINISKESFGKGSLQKEKNIRKDSGYR